MFGSPMCPLCICHYLYLCMPLYLCICVFVVRRKAKKQRAVLERRHLLCGVAINALLLSSYIAIVAYIAEIEKKESEAMSNIDQANKEKPEPYKYATIPRQKNLDPESFHSLNLLFAL